MSGGARPSEPASRRLAHGVDGPLFDGFEETARSAKEGGEPGLRAFDVMSLWLMVFASGAVMGIALRGNILLAIGIFGTIAVGVLVGWMLHALFARRTSRSDSPGASATMRGHDLSRLYSVEWRSTITRDTGWMTIEASSIDEARSKFQKEHGDARVVQAIALITGERAYALPWRQ